MIMLTNEFNLPLECKCDPKVWNPYLKNYSICKKFIPITKANNVCKVCFHMKQCHHLKGTKNG